MRQIADQRCRAAASELRTALNAAFNAGCRLHVQLYPGGRVKGGWWLLNPHCPRCKAQWQEASARQCECCGYVGHPSPEKKRRARGAGRIFRWGGSSEQSKRRSFWSGTRIFEGSESRLVRLKARSAKGSQIIVRTVEIAERLQFGIDGAKLGDWNAAGSDAVEKEGGAELIVGEEVVDVREDRGAIDASKGMGKVILDGNGDVGVAEVVDHGMHKGRNKERDVAACGIGGVGVGR